jgi:thymidylate kinase
VSADTPAFTRLLTAIFAAWTKAEIPFLVLRNYEKLPYSTTNDIDVLVAPAAVEAAERALLTAAQEAGFRLVNRVRFATLAIYLAHPESGFQVHFDLFTDLKWRGFDFLDCNGFLERRVKEKMFFVPSRADEAVSNLLAFLIYTGKVKEKYREGIQSVFAPGPKAFGDTAQALGLLEATYGLGPAMTVLEAVLRRDWAAVEAATGSLRRALVRRQLAKHPLATARSWLSMLGRLAGRWLRPPGLVVVLCGADGCGKSTAAERLIEWLNTTFSPLKGRHYHWKPPVFSARRRAARGPVSDPHGQPPRNTLVSMLYLKFHWLEFFIGAFTAIRPATFKGGLVLIDRFYYDFFVDPRRYRLRLPQWVVRLGYWPLPKPDLVFLLDAPPEVLQARKQEVPFEETARQRAAYRKLIQSLPCGRIIDATQPADKVAADLQQAVLDFLAQRAGARKEDR